MPRKLRLAVDFDSTLLDLHTPWFASVNIKHGTNIKPEDIPSFDTHEHVPMGRAVYAPFDEPGFFFSLRAYPGAIEALQELHNDGHTIYIATTGGNPEAYRDKRRWYEKHLQPLLGKRRLIVLHDKHVLDVDVIIDDRPEQIREFAEHRPNTLRLGIEFPYNRQERRYNLLAPSYKDPEGAWLQMLRYIRRHASEPR